jgi:hypothetical protein
MIVVRNYPANNPLSGTLAVTLREKLKAANIYSCVSGSIHVGYSVEVADGLKKQTDDFLLKEEFHA